jgi:hypothetical protein
MNALLSLVLLLPSQAPGEVATQVRALVRQLDAPQKAVRDEAEQSIVALGPSALAALPNAKSTDSAELTLRVNRVRLALLRAKAESNLHGSHVTLQVTKAPLADVLAEFSRQTGDKLIDYRRQFGQQVDDLHVTLDLNEVPFWAALDRLLDAAGLEVYYFAQEDGLALVLRGPDGVGRSPAPPTAAAGAFRTQVRRLTTTRAFDEPAAELQLELEIAWEPRLRPMFFTAAMAKVQALDATGARLPAGNPDLVLEIPPQGRAAKIELKLHVAAPPRASTTLKRLVGSVDVLLPADQHTFRFENLTDGKRQEQRAAAATVSLDSVRTRGEVLETTLRLKYEHPTNALESHRAWFYKNPAYVEDSTGKRTPPGSIELVRQSNDELTLNLLFPDAGDPARLAFVYQTPADLVTLPIAFDFADLPLP